MAHSKTDDVPIPEIITDRNTGTKYVRGKFYGKVRIKVYLFFVKLIDNVHYYINRFLNFSFFV